MTTDNPKVPLTEAYKMANNMAAPWKVATGIITTIFILFMCFTFYNSPHASTKTTAKDLSAGAVATETFVKGSK